MSPARSRVRQAALVLAIPLLAAGCATSSKAKLSTSAGPEQRFSMTGAGFQTNAVITRDGAQGAQVNLGRYDNGTAIRGSAPGGTVNITVDEAKGHAQGIWGSGPVTLDVTEQENQLQFNGLINGRLSNWTASRERIEGKIGFCSYDLRGANDTYSGSRSCAGGISPVTVVFPSTILEWKPINIGLLMALLMSTI